MDAYDHRLYVNFTRVMFKALTKPKEEEEKLEEMEIERSPKEPQPSTSGT